MVRKSEAKTAPSIETLMEQLTGIISVLEDSEVPLEESMDNFDRGIQIILKVQETLNSLEQRVQVLSNERQK